MFGYAQDAVILQANAIQIVLRDHGAVDALNAFVTEHLREGLIANLVRRELPESANFVMQPVPFPRRERVKIPHQIRRRVARAFDDLQFSDPELRKEFHAHHPIA
jgi:hypothetical protein